MLISLTMSSAREYPPEIVLAPLLNSTSPDWYFTTIPWSWIAYNGHLVLALIPLPAIISVRSRIRSLESTYNLRRLYGQRRNGPNRRRRAKGRLARLLQ